MDAKGWVVVSVLVLAVSGLAAAQDGFPEYYGVGDVNFHYVSAEEFVSADPQVCLWTRGSNNFWFNDGASDQSVVATVRLPTGALVTQVTFIYQDTAVGIDPLFYFDQYWVNPLAEGGTSITHAFPTGEPGVTTVVADVDPDYTIAYFNVGTLSTRSFSLRAVMPTNSGVRLRGGIVHWYRQISPEPAVATFADVPVGAFGFRHIEALVASGITAGCGGGDFCPDANLTRAQMAVFLANALGLHWEP